MLHVSHMSLFDQNKWFVKEYLHMLRYSLAVFTSIRFFSSVYLKIFSLATSLHLSTITEIIWY